MPSYADIIEQLQKVKEPTEDSRRLANSFVVPEQRHTMLHWAVVVRDPHDIAILLKHGANIDSRDINDLTALHLAAAKGRKDMGGEGFKPDSTDYAITILLLEHGADPKKLSIKGWLPERFVIEPRTGTARSNTEDHRDFCAILETFQAQQLQKQTEHKSSDETIATARLSFGSGDGEPPRTQVHSSGLLHHRHSVYRDSDAKDTDERQALLPSKHVESSSNASVTGWLYNALMGTGKPSESKSK